MASPKSNLAMLTKQSERYWLLGGQRACLALFQRAARAVPAYKDFLKKYRFNPARIRTWKDWAEVPVVTKKNYLYHYPLQKLCWNGKLTSSMVFTASSGSTGQSVYFPRDTALDKQSAVLHQLFLDYTAGSSKRSTLIIDCFGMGVWIGGLITYQAFKHITEQGLPLSIITPGINKAEIFAALKHVAPKFDRVVVCGYPPFLKRLFDEAREEGIRFKSSQLKLIFAAEGFSEQFRDHVARTVGVKNVLTDTTNIYGSADLGTMALETPLSIFLRRKALGNKTLYTDLFSTGERLPTFAQFNPLFTQFESLNGEILCTGYSALPLIRYAIGDHGFVMPFSAVERQSEKNKINFKKELSKVGIANTVIRWPFVGVYERSDFSTKLYGAIIYPEHLRDALHHSAMVPFLTGRFTLATQYDEKHNQYLEVHLELKRHRQAHGTLEKEAQKLIVEHLLKKNAEYRNNASVIPHLVKPRIVFWDYEHPTHFSVSGKHRWIKK